MFIRYPIIFCCTVLVFASIALSEVKYCDSDPLLNLITTDAIIQEGSIKLDSYRHIQPDKYTWVQLNGHYYNTYPLGNSVLALPLIFLTSNFGFDTVEYNFHLQKVLATLLGTAAFLLMFFLARRYFANEFLAMVFAAAFFWGSALFSSNGSAYWSHSSSSVFILVALNMLAADPALARVKHQVLMGFCLFFAYFCRPTAALFAVFVLLAIFLYHKRNAIQVGLFTALFVALSFAFNYFEYGVFLTPYSSAAFDGQKPFAALYGHLLSPSRGLLVYSPFLLVVFGFFAANARKIKEKPLLLVALGYPLALFIIMSFWEMWWGGHAFGPRLLTEALPSLFLLACLTWQVCTWKKGYAALFFSLALVAGFINYQGMYKVETAFWNARVGIDANPQKNYDWGRVQFLEPYYNFEQGKAP